MIYHVLIELLIELPIGKLICAQKVHISLTDFKWIYELNELSSLRITVITFLVMIIKISNYL
jgi:hypothetical protein